MSRLSAHSGIRRPGRQVIASAAVAATSGRSISDDSEPKSRTEDSRLSRTRSFLFVVVLLLLGAVAGSAVSEWLAYYRSTSIQSASSTQQPPSTMDDPLQHMSRNGSAPTSDYTPANEQSSNRGPSTGISSGIGSWTGLLSAHKNAEPPLPPSVFPLSGSLEGNFSVAADVNRSRIKDLQVDEDAASDCDVAAQLLKHWTPVVPPRALRRGVSYLGDMMRLDTFLHKASSH